MIKVIWTDAIPNSATSFINKFPKPTPERSWTGINLMNFFFLVSHRYIRNKDINLLARCLQYQLERNDMQSSRILFT